MGMLECLQSCLAFAYASLHNPSPPQSPECRSPHTDPRQSPSGRWRCHQSRWYGGTVECYKFHWLVRLLRFLDIPLSEVHGQLHQLLSSLQCCTLLAVLLCVRRMLGHHLLPPPCIPRCTTCWPWNLLGQHTSLCTGIGPITGCRKCMLCLLVSWRSYSARFARPPTTLGHVWDNWYRD